MFHNINNEYIMKNKEKHFSLITKTNKTKIYSVVVVSILQTQMTWTESGRLQVKAGVWLFRQEMEVQLLLWCF